MKRKQHKPLKYRVDIAWSDEDKCPRRAPKIPHLWALENPPPSGVNTPA